MATDEREASSFRNFTDLSSPPIITSKDIEAVVLTLAKRELKDGVNYSRMIEKYWAEGPKPQNIKEMLGLIGASTAIPSRVGKIKIMPTGHIRLAKSNIAWRWGVSYIKGLLKDLRDVICGDLKVPAKVGKLPKGIFSPIFAGILAALGVTNPIGLTIGTFIAMLLAWLGKKRFCEMTDEEVLEALREQARQAS